MSKYIQKSVEVEARQFTEDPENGQEIATWVNESKRAQATYWEPKAQLGLELQTMLKIYYADDTQDTMLLGDWLVKMDDEFHVYADEAFHKRFDKVEDAK